MMELIDEVKKHISDFLEHDVSDLTANSQIATSIAPAIRLSIRAAPIRLIDCENILARRIRSTGSKTGRKENGVIQRARQEGSG